MSSHFYDLLKNIVIDVKWHAESLGGGESKVVKSSGSCGVRLLLHSYSIKITRDACVRARVPAQNLSSDDIFGYSPLARTFLRELRRT